VYLLGSGPALGHCALCPRGQVKPWAEPPVGKPSNSEQGTLSRPLPGKFKAHVQSQATGEASKGMQVSKGVQDPPSEPFISTALVPGPCNFLRTVHPFAFRAGRDTGDHLAVSIHFTNRKVRFREAVSFVQGPQPVSSRAEEPSSPLRPRCTPP